MRFLERFAKPKIKTTTAEVAPPKTQDVCVGLQRMWEAAITDAQTLEWFGDYGITANDIRGQLPTIRRRCREAAKNDPYVCRALQIYKNNVVGSKGIKLSMDIPDGRGNIDMDKSGAVESAWKLWSETPVYCDAEGKKTLVEILQLIVRSWKLEGEAIVQIVHSSLNPFGIQLKVYRPDAVAIDLVRPAVGKENAIYNGVEVDAIGRPKAYYFYSTLLPSGNYTGELYRVPAKHILHLYDEDEPGQTRGIPVFASILKDLRIAHGYDLAELIAARVDASRVGTWKQVENGDLSKIADTSSPYGLTQSTEPGEDRIAPTGWDYRPDAPSRPNSGYGQFKKDILRRVASGLNVSYNTLANDLEGVSYSSIRAGTLEDREVYKLMQETLVNKFLRPLFRRAGGWLDSFLTTERATRLGLSLDDARAIREADTWLPRRWDWVDPMSEAQAKEIQVSHHWTTDSDIAAEGGKDYFDNVETARQEKEWLAEKGFSTEEIE